MSLHAAERATEVNEQKREAWRRQVEALAPAHLVFVDESGVTRSMTRRYGRAPKGQRVRGAVPLGHWEVTTLIGALVLDGVRAGFSVDAATDADIFQVFAEQGGCKKDCVNGFSPPKKERRRRTDGDRQRSY